jgi:hypothetical protein
MATPYLRRERMFVWGFLTLVAATLAHLIRNGWISMCGSDCFPNRPDLSPKIAPEAYRVALPAAHRFVSTLFHLHDGSLADAILQFVCCLLALYVLYRLTVPAGLTNPVERIAAIGLLFAFFQLPLAFVLAEQRPETIPTALFVAVFLLCAKKAGDDWRWAALLFLATAVQAFARSDVPFVEGLALAVLSLPGRTLAAFGSRAVNLIRGLGVALIAVSVQLYLQLVRFPHLPYATGSPIVIRDNLHSGHGSVLALALLPFVCVLVLARWRRIALQPVEKLACVGLALYLPLWFTVGVIGEVRIGVPLLLALCPMAARVSATCLLRHRLETVAGK